MEFDTLDAPYLMDDRYYEPDSRLVCLGIEMPYREWTKVKPEGATKFEHRLMYGLEESVELIAKKILEDGPYDAIAGFS